MWGFPTDMRIRGDCAVVLQQVLDVVESRADDAYRHRTPRASQAGAARASKLQNAALRPAPTGRLRRAQSGLRVCDAERKIVAARYRHQRGDSQRAGLAGAHHAHQAAELRWLAGGGLGFSGGMALD